MAELLGLRRLPGFVAVGISGLLVNTALLYTITDLIGLHYLISAAVATQGSTLWNFTFHDHFVFRQERRRFGWGGRLLRYLVVNNLMLLLRAPLLALLVESVGMHYLLANLAALALMTALRFLAAQLWVFARPHPAAEGTPTYIYDIHGLLSVVSEVKLPELAAFQRYGEPAQADLVVRRGPPKESLRGQVRIYEDGLDEVGFKIWIEQRGATHVWASKLTCASPHVLYTNVVEPILRWSFTRRGYALVHAAAIAFQGRGGLITAATDTGKTTAVLRTLESRPWRFLSDDMSLLGTDGEILAFPKPMTISSHTLQAVRTARLNWRERVFLAVQSRLHSRAGRKLGLWLAEKKLPAASLNALVQWIIPPPKYPVERLIPWAQTSPRAQLRLLVLLDRAEEAMEILEHSTIVKALLENAEDAYGFPPYAELAPFLSQWDGEDLHAAEKAIITEATRGCSATRLASREYSWWKRLPPLFQFEPEGYPYSEGDTQPTAAAGS